MKASTGNGLRGSSIAISKKKTCPNFILTVRLFFFFNLHYIFVHRKYRDSPSVFFDPHHLAPEFDGVVLDSAGIEL
jgi:hypothetical protein